MIADSNGVACCGKAVNRCGNRSVVCHRPSQSYCRPAGNGVSFFTVKNISGNGIISCGITVITRNSSHGNLRKHLSAGWCNTLTGSRWSCRLCLQSNTDCTGTIMITFRNRITGRTCIQRLTDPTILGHCTGQFDRLAFFGIITVSRFPIKQVSSFSGSI